MPPGPGTAAALGVRVTATVSGAGAAGASGGARSRGAGWRGWAERSRRIGDVARVGGCLRTVWRCAATVHTGTESTPLATGGTGRNANAVQGLACLGTELPGLLRTGP